MRSLQTGTRFVSREVTAQLAAGYVAPASHRQV